MLFKKKVLFYEGSSCIFFFYYFVLLSAISFYIAPKYDSDRIHSTIMDLKDNILARYSAAVHVMSIGGGSRMTWLK